MNSHSRFLTSGITVALLLLATNALSQTTLGTIGGTAIDPTGAAVPNVAVVVRNAATNIENRTHTNEAGSYQVTNLLPGRYAIDAEASGFKKLIVSGVVLETAATVRVDLRLEVGEVSTSLTVEASAPLINTEGMEVANIRTNEALVRLPVNVRGSYNGAYYDMLVLTPGAQWGSGSAFSIAGTRGQQFSSSVDGTSTVSTLFGNATGTAQSTLESTAELRVQLANDKAESALPGGFYATTKSGGNAFHGSLFYYHTNARLTARNAFSTTVPFRIDNDFGGSLGGPVRRNHTFFYFVYETFPRRGESIKRPNVPTVRMRTGDFSALLPTTVVRDPLGGQQPFPGNVIPAGRLSASSLKIQQRFYPLPNSGSPDSYQNNWQGTERVPNYKTQLEGRIDHRFSDANSIFGRWSWNRGGYDNSRAQLPGIPVSHEDRPTTVITISDTHLFSPSLINEFRLGIMKTRQFIEAPLDGPALISEFGLQGYSPNLITKSGMPYFNITGFQSISIATPSPFQDPRQRIYQAVNNVTWMRGAHTVKTGVDLRFNSGINYPGGTYFPAQAYGTFSFTNVFSGFSYADFLLGLPQTSSRGNPAPLYDMINSDFAAFIQDDWKVTRNLTLNVGVRYDFNPPYHERDGRFFHFDPVTGRAVLPSEGSRKFVNQLFPVNLVPITVASEAGLPQSLFYADRNNVVPRLGFAYRPFASVKTVVRGGVGMFTDLDSAGLWGGTTGGLFVSNETFTNSISGGVPRFAFPGAFPAGFGAIGAQNFSSNNPHLRSARIQQWSLTVEREMLSTGFRVSYIGTGSRGLIWGPNINQPQPGLQPFSNSRRRFPALQNITFRQNGGTQQYHSAHVVAERKMKRGVYYQIGWTWAKNLTDVLSDSESGATPQDSYARGQDRGNVEYMARHRVVGNLIYELPFGPGRRWLPNLGGWRRFVFGGWILSGIFVGETGKFFTPTFSGFDVSNTNTIGGRPDRLGDGNLPASERTIRRWFDASAFRVPGDQNGDGRPDVAVGRFGNCAPNILVGPGTLSLNGGLHKEFPLGERARVMIQGTFTNVLNHVNYSNPAANISAPASVGIISSAGAARNGQVALRVEF